ncbi:SDR family oxidoreductase [Roseivirga sp. BDSF3-8]|uniref:SDR family oxidoreductase n=1 Tax=Roseivirga sp. BDSF3-8 TaxID=3241598 RepID=UPI0035321404
MSIEKKLNGQTAIVTGSSSGIGRSVAWHLSQAGANVCINYHSSEEEALELKGNIEKQGGNAIVVQADVGDEKDVDKLFNKTIEAFGGLDILVCNAGIQKDDAFLDMSLDDWQLVMSTNLTGSFLCAQRAARIFKEQGDRGLSCSKGKLLFMSSVHEKIPWAGHVNYATAKGGMKMLMQSLAQELGSMGIRVNSLGPGAIKTPINEDAWKDDEKLNKMLELIPYGRIGETKDIGKAAVWLLSDDADYVHGTTLFVDGGMTTYPGFIGNG